MNNQIKMNALSYTFDADGEVTRVDISYTGLNLDPAGSYLSTTIKIISSDLPSGKTFDDLTKNDLETLGKSKLAEIIDDSTTTTTTTAAPQTTTTTSAQMAAK